MTGLGRKGETQRPSPRGRHGRRAPGWQTQRLRLRARKLTVISPRSVLAEAGKALLRSFGGNVASPASLDFRPLASRTVRKCTSTVKPPSTPGHHVSAVPGAETQCEEGRRHGRGQGEPRERVAGPQGLPSAGDGQAGRQRPPAPRMGCPPPWEQMHRPGMMGVSEFERWNDAVAQLWLLCPAFLLQFSTIGTFSTCCSAVTVIKAAGDVPPGRCTAIALTPLSAPV